MMLVNVPILTSYGVIDGDCDIYDLSAGKPIFTTLFVFAYVLPLAVIAAVSLLILRHITGQRAACSTLATSRGPDTKGKSRYGRKQQASRLLILVVALFALLWLPVHIYLMLAFFVGIPNNDFVTTVAVIFLYNLFMLLYFA